MNAVSLTASSSMGPPPARTTSSCRIFSTLNFAAVFCIRPSTSSKSNSVDVEKRIGLMRATTNGRRYGLVKPRFFSLSTMDAHLVVDREDEAGAPLALLQRFRQRLVEEVVDPAEQRLIRAAAEARTLFVRRAERQERAAGRTRTRSRARCACRARRPAREACGSPRATSLSGCAPSRCSARGS